MDSQIFEELGLTNSEIKVYLALIELGKSSTGKIVEKSTVSSSKVYEVLDRLIQRGLATFIIERGTKFFEAAEPETILDIIEERE